MYEELILTVSGEKHKAFFMNGFHKISEPASNLHKHKYAEIHLSANGNALFNADGRKLPLDMGSIMIIPKGVFHCCAQKDESTIHTAFQIDFKTDEIKTAFIGNDILFDFIKEIESAKASGNYSKISSCISLFCNYLDLGKPAQTHPVTDYGFLIHEFLSLHYNDNIRLCDLANELHLSERQTERLVIQHTGKTFKNTLSDIRVTTAKQLISSSAMSQSEAAKYVGYESYAGYWKAVRKFDE